MNHGELNVNGLTSGCNGGMSSNWAENLIVEANRTITFIPSSFSQRRHSSTMEALREDGMKVMDE